MSTKKPVGKSTKKRTPTGDVTRSARAGIYLERLKEAKGKRVVIDLAQPAVQALEKLLASGYAESQKEAVTKALLLAAAVQSQQA